MSESHQESVTPEDLRAPIRVAAEAVADTVRDGKKKLTDKKAARKTKLKRYGLVAAGVMLLGTLIGFIPGGGFMGALAAYSLLQIIAEPLKDPFVRALGKCIKVVKKSPLKPVGLAAAAAVLVLGAAVGLMVAFAPATLGKLASMALGALGKPLSRLPAQIIGRKLKKEIRENEEEINYPGLTPQQEAAHDAFAALTPLERNEVLRKLKGTCGTGFAAARVTSETAPAPDAPAARARPQPPSPTA